MCQCGPTAQQGGYAGLADDLLTTWLHTRQAEMPIIADLLIALTTLKGLWS